MDKDRYKWALEIKNVLVSLGQLNRIVKHEYKIKKTYSVSLGFCHQIIKRRNQKQISINLFNDSFLANINFDSMGKKRYKISTTNDKYILNWDITNLFHALIHKVIYFYTSVQKN